jgi:hypothetical protein
LFRFESGLSANALAKALGVPVARMLDRWMAEHPEDDALRSRIDWLKVPDEGA